MTAITVLPSSRIQPVRPDSGRKPCSFWPDAVFKALLTACVENPQSPDCQLRLRTLCCRFLEGSEAGVPRALEDGHLSEQAAEAGPHGPGRTPDWPGRATWCFADRKGARQPFLIMRARISRS